MASAVDHNAQSAGVVAADLLAAWEMRRLVGQGEVLLRWSSAPQTINPPFCPHDLRRSDVIGVSLVRPSTLERWLAKLTIV